MDKVNKEIDEVEQRWMKLEQKGFSKKDAGLLAMFEEARRYFCEVNNHMDELAKSLVGKPVPQEQREAVEYFTKLLNNFSDKIDQPPLSEEYRLILALTNSLFLDLISLPEEIVAEINAQKRQKENND